MGLIALPAMLNRGYNKSLALGCILAGGAIRPIRVTGTISIGMPFSTQSSRFWHESSP